MSGRNRREFLRTSATLLSTAAVAACVPSDAGPARPTPDPARLDALAGAVLPSELGVDGQARVVSGFRQWLDEFEPVAELNHGYGTHEIAYGPADPAPRWIAQLDALDLEADKRYGRGFAALSVDDRRDLLRRHLAGERGGLPGPGRADHVATGLLAWFYASPEATDLCYQARVGRDSCRDIHSTPARPAPLGTEA